MNRSASLNSSPILHRAALKRGLVFGGIIFSALIAFEVFNYSSTAFALSDVLGDLAFGPFKWATILAFAFCGIDFAGIARIFTPEKGADEPAEVWYLFGAWFIAAAFNASLTWWGVSVAILKHSAQGGVLLGQDTMTKVVPIMVAVMVWLIRVLIIGTFAIAGERLFTLADAHDRYSTYRNQPAYSAPQPRTYRPAPVEGADLPPMNYPRPAPNPRPYPVPNYGFIRAEPTYHPIGMGAMSRDNNPSTRR